MTSATGTRESEGRLDSSEELRRCAPSGFDLCSGGSCVPKGLADEGNPQV
jgi:hypothetical protein